jgi:predicted dehydrogenase
VSLRKVSTAGKKEIAIGVLGCGFMGRCHTNAYKQIPYVYPDAHIMPRLAILCDKNEQKVQQQAARYGYEHYCTDWNEVVSSDKADVFDNCGPDPVHPEPCIAALKNGKHVICEKPLALSVADAGRMRDAARSARGKAMCVFNYRFMPAVRFAKDLIDAGRLGTLYHIRVNYMQFYGHNPSLKPDQVWYSAWPHSGVLQGIGCHAIDQCRFLVGEIKSVSAVVRTFNQERAIPTVGCDDAVSDEATAAILEFENGAVGVMESSGVVVGRKNHLSWEINGSKGSLKWDMEHPNSLFACLEGLGDNALSGFTEISVTHSEHPYVNQWWGPGHNIGWEHSHIIEKFYFLDAVANDKDINPYNATFEDGYRVAVIVDAMRKSSDLGKKIELRSGGEPDDGNGATYEEIKVK